MQINRNAEIIFSLAFNKIHFSISLPSWKIEGSRKKTDTMNAIKLKLSSWIITVSIEKNWRLNNQKIKLKIRSKNWRFYQENNFHRIKMWCFRFPMPKKTKLMEHLSWKEALDTLTRPGQFGVGTANFVLVGGKEIKIIESLSIFILARCRNQT